MASTLLASLAACSSGGGSGNGNAGGGLGPLKPEGTVKAGSVGVFTADKEMTLKDGIIPQEMNLPRSPECAAKSDDNQLRPILQAKVGDKIVESVSNATTESTYSGTSESWIVSLTANSVVTNQRTSHIAITPDPGFPIPASVTMQTTCDLEDGNTQHCDYKFLDFSEPEEKEDNSLHCSLDQIKWTETQGTVALGKFRLSSGLVVNAQKTDKTSKGRIICHRGKNGKEMDLGTGTEIISQIMTDEVVSLRPVSCLDHLSVYRYSTIIKDDGTTIGAGKSEVLEGLKR